MRYFGAGLESATPLVIGIKYWLCGKEKENDRYDWNHINVGCTCYRFSCVFLERLEKIGGWYVRKMNERIKRLTIIDIVLTKWAAFFGTIIVVKIFPQLLNIGYTVLIVLMLAVAAKPIYVIWLKK